MSSDQAVRRMYVDGQRRWPQVDLAFERFRGHCLAVLGANPQPERLRFGAELFLCCACAARDTRATLAFERETAAVAKAAITRINRDRDFVEETLRELWDKLLFSPTAKVAEYSARGSLQAWTRVAAARTAIDRSRAQRVSSTRRIELREHFGGTVLELDSMLVKARYGSTFQRALEHALEELTAQDRNLLRMHVVDRCGIDQIGRAYGVHRATAARWLERARAQVLASIRHQLCLAHGELTDSEILSIAHVLGGELVLTFASTPAEADWRCSPVST